MEKKLRVGVLFGGRSGEHEVSIASATSVIQNLDHNKYDIVPIAIDKAGSWLLGIDPPQLREIEAGSQSETERQTPLVTLTTEPTLHRVVALHGESLPFNGTLDVIFPILHGTYGEDGTLQGLLEMANIPYVGCGVLASAIGMDKEKTKIILRGLGVPVIDALTYTRLAWERSPESILESIEQRLNYPCFVKPVNLGSSVGISKARNREQLIQAINLAAEFDRRILVERAVNCREFSCGVLANEEPIASVIGEIIAGNEFSDYNDKYVDHKIQFVIPAALPQETTEELRSIALQTYRGLDLNGLARVDFFLDKDSQQFFVNEVNTMPGFTSMSLYPRLWAASGLAYTNLLDRLIQLAFERYNDRQQNRTFL